MEPRRRLVRIPLGLAFGTFAFWAGLARLVVMSTRLTVSVMRGEHPYEALLRMSRERGKAA